MNVPLGEWAGSQNYKKWFIFQKNGTQVLVWSKMSEIKAEIKIEDLTQSDPILQTEVQEKTE